jgi:hypothetical protein
MRLTHRALAGAAGVALAAALWGAPTPAAAGTYVNTLFTDEGFLDDVVDDFQINLRDGQLTL